MNFMFEYTSDLLTPYIPSSSLRSSNQSLLVYFYYYFYLNIFIYMFAPRAK